MYENELTGLLVDGLVHVAADPAADAVPQDVPLARVLDAVEPLQLLLTAAAAAAATTATPATTAPAVTAAAATPVAFPGVLPRPITASAPVVPTAPAPAPLVLLHIHELLVLVLVRAAAAATAAAPPVLAHRAKGAGLAATENIFFRIIALLVFFYLFGDGFV